MTFLDLDFWIGVGVIAGIYGLFALGLQLNVGFTGLINLGQAGFMAIGAYTMGMLVVDAGWRMAVAFPTAVGVAIAAGVLVGLPSLRLRAGLFRHRDDRLFGDCSLRAAERRFRRRQPRRHRLRCGMASL